MKRKKLLLPAGLLGLWVAGTLSGCSSIALLNPNGPVGDIQRSIIIISIVLMLIVVVPVFIMAFLFGRKYRASNPQATYMPKWHYSVKLDLVVWLVPIVIVLVLSYLAWIHTYQLDPYRPLVSDEKPINIEAVSLDWKWLFIYPDQNIATVNEIVFPANVPLSFRLTSDTVMTSFFIPQLGSQIYAMAGMQTRLHLLADKPGVYAGQNQQYSGRGYADMHFKATATSPEEFDAWVQKAKESPEALDMARYDELAKPSQGHFVAYYSSVEPDLFDRIMRKYNPAMGGHHTHHGGEAVSMQGESTTSEAH